MSDKTKCVIAAVFCTLLVVAMVFYNTPTGRGIINNYFHEVQKVDDSTSYATRKQVEDGCRAMISSYESDRLTYEQYKDSESEEQRNWADQAKMRANKTASSYNNYILKNSYVWAGNVPEDISQSLSFIE